MSNEFLNFLVIMKLYQLKLRLTNILVQLSKLKKENSINLIYKEY